MKKRFQLIGVAFLLLTTQTNAQLLWKVDGNGLKDASYIFGTHHLAPANICENISGFDAAFNSCKQLYGEIDMSNMNETQSEMMKFMMLPQDSLLDVLYTPEEYEMIDGVLKTYMGMGIDKLKMLKPAALTAQLTILMNMKFFKDFDLNKAIDVAMQNRARDKGMIVKGLETATYQANLLFNMPIEEQAANLLKTAKNIDKSEKFSLELKNAYIEQNIDKLFEYLQDSELGTTEEEMEKLIYVRNNNWVNQTKTIFQEPTFIVVGVGHLPGDKGLLNLLRKQGYTVTAIR